MVVFPCGGGCACQTLLQLCVWLSTTSVALAADWPGEDEERESPLRRVALVRMSLRRWDPHVRIGAKPKAPDVATISSSGDQAALMALASRLHSEARARKRRLLRRLIRCASTTIQGVLGCAFVSSFDERSGDFRLFIFDPKKCPHLLVGRRSHPWRHLLNCICTTSCRGFHSRVGRAASQ